MQPGAWERYPPTLGHFSALVDPFAHSLSAPRFGLRYANYSRFAGGPSSPVLFYCGNEAPLPLFYNASGAIFEHAAALRAHVVVVEHRYYGESLPFGPNASFAGDGLRYLSIEHALADYSAFIEALPTILGCAGASYSRCRVILFGGSYGGMLAAWHRYRYPHLSLGAIASGAPIDFYPSPSGAAQRAFHLAVTRTFERYGDDSATVASGCGAALDGALAAAAAASTDELARAGVRPCRPFGRDAAEKYTFYARGAMASIALADYPYPCSFIAPLPSNPVQHACQALLRPPTPPNATISPTAEERVASLSALHTAVLGLVNASGDLRCVSLDEELVGDREPPAEDALLGTLSAGRGARPPAASRAWQQLRTRWRERETNLGTVAWNFQACTELILEPLTSDGFGFYPPAQSQLDKTRALCKRRFGIEPRPAWLLTAFGRGPDFSHASNVCTRPRGSNPRCCDSFFVFCFLLLRGATHLCGKLARCWA